MQIGQELDVADALVGAAQHLVVAEVGKHVAFEASGNIAYTEDEDHVIVTVGVHGLVVKRGNTVLLVAKDEVDAVKTVLAEGVWARRERPGVQARPVTTQLACSPTPLSLPSP